jgi:biotin-dependent carboxylase-like uncharacterized protein
MSLRILDPGWATYLVDYGRPGSRSLGVPVGGAADRCSLSLGNGLVGNPPDAAALEITLSGPRLQAGCELACVIYGAPFALHCDSQRLTNGKTFTLQPGEEVRIAAASQGMRAYVCVSGGFLEPEILHSRSSLEPLTAGRELACRSGAIGGRWMLASPADIQRGGVCRAGVVLRTLAGPQADWFDLEELYAQEFRVAEASNRMGVRLRGEPLIVPERELVSEPVAPGAVQVTPDRQCIVLGVDGQTIGGYPKIAHVISADMDVLGQVRPGDRVRFTGISLEEAATVYLEKQRRLHEWIVRLRTSPLAVSGTSRYRPVS